MERNYRKARIARDFFKMSTLIILFLLISFQLIGLLYSLEFKIVPDAVSFSIAFVCILYLWIVEIIDRERLMKMNLELIVTQSILKESQINTIMSLGLSQEAKDRYTQGHSERVTKYSVELAKEMGLSEDEIETIKRASKLHDIGKIGISDDILFSKDLLTEEQYNILKYHPIKSVNILDPLKFLDKEKKIIRHHHERYDGTGYPDRLKGNNIPLGSRIIAIADAFDAMKSERPYKDSLSKKEIVAELIKNTGTQFDPKVSKVFLRIIDRFFI
jgi:HD-GYP domain-containing protein (c-di-GMP phosphodiesterase class II)